MIAYRFGYDITTDLHHGFIVVWGKKRRVIALHWNWPYFLWFNRDWTMDEAGYIQGMPVYRKVKKKWLLRAFVWPVSIQLGNWQTNRWIYLGAKVPKRPDWLAMKGTPGGTWVEPIVDYRNEEQLTGQSALDYYD